MQGKAKLLGHPIHQMLVVFPLGLLATGVVFDLVFIGDHRPLMAVVAYWMIAAGIIGGLLAAPFGLIDWLSIPKGTRAKSIGGLHGLGNLVVVLLFLGSWLMRRPAPETPGLLAHTLSFVGAGLALVTAWLGGELVDRLGIGVYEDANVDAPSSLHARRIHEQTRGVH